MTDQTVAEHDLTIARGATWPAHAWPLLGDDGAPLRVLPITGMTIAAKIRAHPTSHEPLHTFTATTVLIALPNLYGDEPVVCAHLAQIPHTATAGWTWDCGVWDLLVEHHVVMAGRVFAPLVVSR